jgi:hypothetical protein
MGAGYLSYVKFIANEAPTFLGYIISVLASVNPKLRHFPLAYFLLGSSHIGQKITK